MTPPLILASTSKYRSSLLTRLGLEFESVAPNINEDEFKNLGLAPLELAKTLSQKKSESVFRLHPEAVVIGGDQVVSFDGTILGKPGNFGRAVQQLSAMSGKSHELLTSICVTGPDYQQVYTDITRLTFRELTSDEIERYVTADEPFDCAGGYKLEERGITLFACIESEDHSAVTGIPLIQLTSILREIGYPIP